LAQKIFALAGLRAGDVDAGDGIAAQQCGQGARIQPVGFDLRVGDEAGLEGMASTISSTGSSSSSTSWSSPQFQQASRTTLLGPSSPAKNWAKAEGALPSMRASRSLCPCSSVALTKL
jgi:hypothetical protein